MRCISIAVSYWNRKECGAVYSPTDLTEGEWACLEGIVEGKGRAMSQESATTSVQSQMDQYNKFSMMK